MSRGIPWDQLIKFANEKKAEEEKSGKPAQLNQQQIIAISQLIDLVHDIEVEDKWVGELNKYCQQNKLALPIFAPETFTLQVYGTNVPRSRVTCIITSKQQSFPKEGYGYEAGQEVPSFKKAQKAKNYAAMHALRFLQGAGPSSRGSKRSASMTQESPTHTKVKAEEDTCDVGVSTAGPSLSKDTGAQIPISSTTAPSTTATQGPTIRERVAVLGERLGFGIPEYYIEQSTMVNDDGETWMGRPAFRNDGRIPEGMGVVTGIAERQQAEDLVAEKVLEWLQKEEKLRKEQVASIGSV
ncbi:uncharacterized protein QYS62_005823 [Fusarium acuminatum]|uniref:DRBM domain-containing protein n=1 Tax=Fusarium acuminatum TaxID=5515 RepID=A0ABZ2WWG7_9HYPO